MVVQKKQLLPSPSLLCHVLISSDIVGINGRKHARYSSIRPKTPSSSSSLRDRDRRSKSSSSITLSLSSILTSTLRSSPRVKLSGCLLGKLLRNPAPNPTLKPALENDAAWSRYCAGRGGTGGASSGSVTVRPVLLLKLQLRSSTAAARSRSSWPVAFLPEDGGLWSWLFWRKWEEKPEPWGMLPVMRGLVDGADWYDRPNPLPEPYLFANDRSDETNPSN